MRTLDARLATLRSGARLTTHASEKQRARPPRGLPGSFYLSITLARYGSSASSSWLRHASLPEHRVTPDNAASMAAVMALFSPWGEVGGLDDRSEQMPSRI